MARQTKLCNICEKPIVYGNHVMKDNSATLDRIFNTTENLNSYNVWILCNACNREKSSRTMLQFVEDSYKLCKKFMPNFNE